MLACWKFTCSNEYKVQFMSHIGIYGQYEAKEEDSWFCAIQRYYSNVLL